jgi:hypothetical protein
VVVVNCTPLFNYGTVGGTWSYTGNGYDAMRITPAEGDVRPELAGSIPLGAMGARCYGRTTLPQGQSAFVAVTDVLLDAALQAATGLQQLLALRHGCTTVTTPAEQAAAIGLTSAAAELGKAAEAPASRRHPRPAQPRRRRRGQRLNGAVSRPPARPPRQRPSHRARAACAARSPQDAPPAQPASRVQETGRRSGVHGSIVTGTPITRPAGCQTPARGVRM